MEKVTMFEVFLLSEELPNPHWRVLVQMDCTEDQFNNTLDAEFHKRNIDSSEFELEYDFLEHIIPTTEQEKEISESGYAIIPFTDVPVKLPIEPSRGEVIDFIKINSEQHRFFDFSNYTHYDLWEVIVKMQ
ncbi:MAG: hypothetical protein ACJA0Q_001748 [Saprospiraceae bacterium]|jgi:hypothetical protein